jgi:hypothetical protein
MVSQSSFREDQGNGGADFASQRKCKEPCRVAWLFADLLPAIT